MTRKIEPIPEDELRNMYWDEMISISNIAKLVGVSDMTIHNWLKMYKIPRRTISEAHIGCEVDVPTKEDLCDMYWDKEMTLEKIGQIIGVDRGTIQRWMKKYDIQRRTLSKSHLLLDNRGPDHYLWKGGPKTYCYKFNERLKEAVRNRDDYTCQNCGKTQEENYRKLDIHHVHYDAENCYPDLISLCHSCHNSSNSNRDWWETHYMCLLEGRGLSEWKPPWAEER